MDLGGFIFDYVEFQSLEDFINHLKLELWESLCSCEFKLKGGILKIKTSQQQKSGEKVLKRMIYR